jgi:ABC-type branched-subunit amino acid transport system ATPase component
MKTKPRVLARGISFNGVKKSFDGLIALDGLDLELRDSGIVAVIGPNGAGKTTLLDVVTARLRPEAGSVHIDGVTLGQSARPPLVASYGVARTFQELRVFRQMSVLENMMVARRPQSGEHLGRALMGFGIRKQETRHREEALRVLHLVGLDNEYRTRAGELSYGQQKLLALAQCLATDARILLLDEPIAGVHPELVEKIIVILRKVACEAKLIVIVEHDIAVVRRLADRLIVLDRGRVIADGAPAEVLSRPEILEAYIG